MTECSKITDVITNVSYLAPPPSLQESTPIIPPTAFASNSDNKLPANVTSYGSSSVAAKIMAKYGFKVESHV